MRKEWVVAQAGRTAQIMEETFHEVVRSNTVLLPGTKSKFTAEIRSKSLHLFSQLILLTRSSSLTLLPIHPLCRPNPASHRKTQSFVTQPNFPGYKPERIIFTGWIRRQTDNTFWERFLF